MRVLLIAKPDEFALSFAARLEAEGAAVVTADSGEDGVRAAEQGRFDLVILDLELPAWTG